MVRVNLEEAKIRFSELIDRTLEGEEVIITRAGKSVVRMVPVNAVRQSGGKSKRPSGFLPELSHIPDSVWFDPLPDDELDQWYNGPIFPVDDDPD